MEYRELEVGEVIEKGDQARWADDRVGSTWRDLSPGFTGDRVILGIYVFRRPISEVEGLKYIGKAKLVCGESKPLECDLSEFEVEGVEVCDKIRDPYVEEIARLKGHLNSVRKVFSEDSNENQEARSFYLDTQW